MSSPRCQVGCVEGEGVTRVIAPLSGGVCGGRGGVITPLSGGVCGGRGGDSCHRPVVRWGVWRERG